MKLPVTPSRVETPLSDHALGPIVSTITKERISVEEMWVRAADLIGLIKNYTRATTVSKALCGMCIRKLREHHFDDRNPKGGRPKLRRTLGEFKTWNEMLVKKIGIEERTAQNWMKMADAVEKLAMLDGISLRETCEKLPWDWTPEEAKLIETTVQRLTEDKTQRDLLQIDFLSDLGYTAPERINSSNNPLGKNGGKKTPAATPQAKLEGLRTLARTEIFGHDSKDHRPKPGSPAFWMDSVVAKAGMIGKDEHPLASLPQQELKEIHDLLFKPFMDQVKALLNR